MIRGSKESFKPRARLREIPASEAEASFGKSTVSRYIDFRQKHIHCFGSDFAVEGAVQEFPYIELTEYELKQSVAIEQFVYFSLNVGRGITGEYNNKDIYKGLYLVEPTGYRYVLPFYTPYHHAVQQGWQEINGTGVEGIDWFTNLVVGAQKLIRPAGNLLYPRTYTGANEAFIPVEFDLVNTATSYKNAPNYFYPDGAIKNKMFLERLISKNLHHQAGGIAVHPPCIYELYIPGVRWSPVAVVQTLSVKNKGTLNNWKNYIVPDAWNVSITFRELLNESRLMYDEAVKGAASSDGIDVKVVISAKEREAAAEALDIGAAVLSPAADLLPFVAPGTRFIRDVFRFLGKGVKP